MDFKTKGIDVSKWQENIDWKKVKADGIKFAMLRLGFGSSNGNSCKTDSCFEKHLSNAVAAGIDVGCYFYSYAKSAEAAKREAEYVISVLNKHKGVFTYPVAFDLEDVSQAGLGKDVLTNMVIAFCDTIEKAGFYCSLYSNLNWLNNYLDDSRLTRFDHWLAQWSSAPTYKGDFGMWQFTSSGTVSGISGRVDMNYAYKDYPSIIKNGKLNGFTGTEGNPFKPVAKKTNEQIADEVLAGKWGNGDDRKKRLTAAGYDYKAIQDIVNKKVSKPKLKSIDEIAREVIRGDWGNGAERVKKLTAAGYNAKAVQERVNKLV